MIVSFIEEERIREQLKNLMEDDAKRKRGVMAVLRRDKKLANDVLNLETNKKAPVDKYSSLKRSITPNRNFSGKVQSAPVVDADKNRLQRVKAEPKPVLKKLLKQDSTINNLNASLEAYNSKMKGNESKTNVNTVQTKNPKANATNKKQTTETNQPKQVLRATPRSNVSISKTNTKGPVPVSPIIKKTAVKKTNTVANKPLKSSPNNTLANKQLKPSATTSSKASIKPKVSPPVKPKTALTSTVSLPTTIPKKPTLVKKVPDKVDGKSLQKSVSTSDKITPKVSSMKTISKKPLKTSASTNIETKDKPPAGGPRPKIATVPLKAKSNVSTGISRNVQDDFPSTLEQIGKVKALVEKIKALNMPETEAVVKGKTDSKQVPQKTEMGKPKPKKRLSPKESLTKVEEVPEKKPKSDFDLEAEELQQIIKQQSKEKKPKVEPILYSMKGFFGDREEDIYGLSSFDDDSDDIESLALYTDSECDSDYTLRNDIEVSSTDDDDSFARHFSDQFEGEDASNDTDYKLPDDEVEDVVIHKGTATIRDIKREENKLFDSDDEESKIVEIPQKNRAVKSVKQPKAYCKEELMKLTVYTSAASSSKMRKRHLALRAEDNDLQSQKSLPKLNLRSEKKDNEKDTNDSTKVTSFEEVMSRDGDGVQKVITEMEQKNQNISNPWQTIFEETKKLEEKKALHEPAMRADSCPLLASFVEFDKQNDFGIPTIQSAAPKFNIFKSETVMENHRTDFKNDEGNESDCPQLVPMEQSQTHSAAAENGQATGNLIDHGAESDDSMFSVDINNKYLYTLDDQDSSAEDGTPPIKVAVLDATQCNMNTSNIEESSDKTNDNEVDAGNSNHTSQEDDKLSSEAEKSDDSIEMSENKMDIDSSDFESTTEGTKEFSSEESEAKDAKQVELDKACSKNSLKENKDAVTESVVQTKFADQPKSTNPFEDNDDLIIFSDENPIVHYNASNDPNPDPERSLPDLKDEFCLEKFVNNTLHQCIMYAIQVSDTPERKILGDNEFQIVTTYAPPENAQETENIEVPEQQVHGSVHSVESEEIVAKTIFAQNPQLNTANNVEENPLQSNPTAKKDNKASKKEYLNVHMNSLVSRKVLLLLRNPIYIYGTVRLTVLLGNVDIFGYKASSGDSLEIFSTKGSSLIKLQPLCTESVEYDEGFVRSSLEKVKDHFTPLDLRNMKRLFVSKTDALIVLHRNDYRKKLIQNFNMFMNENIFPNIKSFNSKPPFGGSEHLLKCKILTNTEQALNVPFEWTHFQLSKHSRVIIAGGKGVGKSTFLRYVINKHIHTYEKILLIDLDIGQPEIFVPQTVSYTVLKTPLLGPGFFLNKQPHKAYVVGHTNVVMCPLVYKNAIRDLIKECHTNAYLREIPWVVNTMGYNKGFGLELMALIAELIHPTDMVQIDSSKDINNFDIDLDHRSLSTQMGRFVDDVKAVPRRDIREYTLHKFESVSGNETRYNKEWSMSSKDMRYAMLIARLSDALYGEAQMLTDCKPLWINFHKIHLYNAVTNHQSKSELLRACEGNLVYMGSYVDDSKPIECYGIGVVRAIDYSTERLYFVPAMPLEYMNYVNCLVIGEMALPNSIYKNQGYRITHNVPFVFETDDNKASKAIKQIFHRPSEFLLGSKQSFDA